MENAPLRVLGKDGLISAPIDDFDTALLGHVTPEWQKMARIVSSALYDFAENGVYQASDLVPGSRLTGLAGAGTLEWRGDLGNTARCEMRLPA